jgi:hypothetical protein
VKTHRHNAAPAAVRAGIETREIIANCKLGVNLTPKDIFMKWKGYSLLVAVLAAGIWCFTPPHYWHHIFMKQIIETLDHPIIIKGWNSQGLIKADGRVLPIPGVKELPQDSVALSEFIQHGAELGTNGQVTVLAKIHHWCGNDTVNKHLARVNLSDALLFLRIGTPMVPVPEGEYLAVQSGGRFTEWGWNVSEFHSFQMWIMAKNSSD